MAAGLGFKTFTTGEVLTAADTNGYLMQGVLVFASAAARDAAITSPQEGQCCYLKDTDAVLTYSGAAWVGFDDSNAIQNSIVDAKGDLISATADNTPARLAVGATNGMTLQVDSTTATGLKWATASSGAMVLITRQSFSNVTTTTTTFDSIFSSTYGSYLVVIESMYAGTAADDLHCQFRYAGPTTQAASYFGNDLSTESGTTTTTNAAQSNTAFAVLSRYTGPSTSPGQGQFSVFNASGASAEPSIVSSYIEGGRGASVNSIVSTLAARTYTGLIFKSSSSNITGTVSVYGLVKV